MMLQARLTLPLATPHISLARTHKTVMNKSGNNKLLNIIYEPQLSTVYSTRHYSESTELTKIEV